MVRKSWNPGALLISKVRAVDLQLYVPEHMLITSKNKNKIKKIMSTHIHHIYSYRDTPASVLSLLGSVNSCNSFVVCALYCVAVALCTPVDSMENYCHFLLMLLLVESPWSCFTINAQLNKCG